MLINSIVYCIVSLCDLLGPDLFHLSFFYCLYSHLLHQFNRHVLDIRDVYIYGKNIVLLDWYRSVFWERSLSDICKSLLEEDHQY